MNECEEDCGFCGRCVDHHEHTKRTEDDEWARDCWEESKSLIESVVGSEVAGEYHVY